VSDQRELREDPAGPGPAPEAPSGEGLTPGVWVTGLIAVVLLLLAAFALG
jgi:hypothetical protein